ncbi:MAG: GSU2403 family nucleotidyltransferase fold protein [Candidatus Methylomirabilales bacterium]
MRFKSPEDFLGYVLRAIVPYLDSLVLVGGFAVRLYRFHPRAAPTGIVPLVTFDADFVAPPELEIKAGRRLSDLVADADLEPNFFGDCKPPVMKFFPKEGETPRQGTAQDQYYVEFLTPLIGGGTDRAGNVVGTREIQKGVTAQRLRYLDLLTVNPWQIPLARLPGMGAKLGDGNFVKVPDPGLFIVQKILISRETGRQEERPKDMAYIYEVLALFRGELRQLAEGVRRIPGKGSTWQRWIARSKRMAAELFKTPIAPGVTEAHAVFAAAAGGGEVPTPEMIHAGVQAFLKQL